MKKKEAMELGRCLEKLRTEAKMTQADVAQVARISPASYSRLERGDTENPRPGTLEPAPFVPGGMDPDDEGEQVFRWILLGMVWGAIITVGLFRVFTP